MPLAHRAGRPEAGSSSGRSLPAPHQHAASFAPADNRRATRRPCIFSLRFQHAAAKPPPSKNSIDYLDHRPIFRDPSGSPEQSPTSGLHAASQRRTAQAAAASRPHDSKRQRRTARLTQLRTRSSSPAAAAWSAAEQRPSASEQRPACRGTHLSGAVFRPSRGAVT